MQGEYLKKRTLYLIERGNGTVVKRDGPSVLIERRFTAPVRIPGDYIDKVIIYGNVEIDAFSITLFSSKGAPILIIGRHGETSIVLPNTDEIKSYSKYQKMMLESEKLVEKFTTWINEKRIFNQKKVLSNMFKNITISLDEKEENYYTMVNKIKPSEFLWEMIRGIMKNFLSITILSKLINAKLDPHVGIINQNNNYGLVSDIYKTCEPISDLLTFQFFYADGANMDFIKNPELNSERLQMIVDKFEKKKKEIELELNATIAQILSYVRSVTP